ncbi:MAG: hypothetical protein ABMA25_24245 [Ilumatobacteraceae bacterium]
MRDHVGVDLLLNVHAISRLAPFLHAEHTLGSAAKAADIPASSLAYWVHRFLTAGLIEITRVEPRAGKPIPHYRAVSSEFQVPFDAMPPGMRDDFLLRGRKFAFDQFIAASNRAAAKAFGDTGVRIVASTERGVELSFIEPADQPDAHTTEWWGSCTLTEAEAVEVNQILKDLQERFGRDHEGPGRTNYHLVLGFVPALRK